MGHETDDRRQGTTEGGIRDRAHGERTGNKGDRGQRPGIENETDTRQMLRTRNYAHQNNLYDHVSQTNGCLNRGTSQTGLCK